ncbi:hypothetical protein [Desulfohalovibrio reitneri]|uniref:hypothetical protein n=1 Tax=Desulfohalovibrio reitneri TaxID=1307759 RepID=UPI0009E09C55|nr:hypothetical protein [Desulfohalovibrio reitneri]
MLHKTMLCVALAMLLASCATPVGYTNKPLQSYDKDTDYRIDEKDGGFTIVIYYSRYQFVPESDAVLESCKQQLMSIAHEHGESVGKSVLPINEQTIKVSMGRNGLTGITSCSAMGSVSYQSNTRNP